MSEKTENTEVIDGIIPFELIIGDAGGQIDNGDVPIRWCASPTFIKELEAKSVVDPHVLIASYSINNNGKFTKEMDRKLVPLGELMTYLRFTRAGKCKVYGLLLDGEAGRDALHTTWMRARRGERDNFVNHYADALYPDNAYQIADTAEFVEIPEGVFGKEPHPLVKWYVNLWHDSGEKISDECDFKKRFLIAIIFKWIPFLPYVTLRILGRLCITGGLALAGYFKEVEVLRSFRPYKYPSFTYNLTDGGINGIKDNFFLFKRPDFSDDTQKTVMTWGLAFTPLTLLFLSVAALSVDVDGLSGFIGVLMGTITILFVPLLIIDIFVVAFELMVRFDVGGKIAHGIINFIYRIINIVPSFDVKADPNTLKYVALGCLGLVIVSVFGVGVIWLVGIIGLGIVMGAVMFGVLFLLLLFSNKLIDWMEKHSALSAKNNDYASITALLCPKEEDNLRPNYKYIPKKQRTKRLWYRDLKNNMCKPMQQK